MSARALLLGLAVTALGAAPASAAELTLQVSPRAGVRLGSKLRVTGRATEQGKPLADRTVVLEARRYPFKGGWRRRAATTTRADGRFSFARAFDRNHRLRARLLTVAGDGAYVPPLPEVRSRVRTAFVLPAFTLGFTQRGSRTIRIKQTYTVPRDVRLRAPTRFYLAPFKARRARFRAQAPTRRVRAGRYVASATIRLPAGYNGRFRYLSCFAYSRGSGMGNPGTRCPRRYARLSQRP